MGKRPVGVPPPVPTTTQANQPTNDVANGRNSPLPGAGGRSAPGGTSWGTSMGREGREGRERG